MAPAMVGRLERREGGEGDPTNNALLVNCRLSSDEETFVNNRRLSIQIGAKRAKTCIHCVHIPTELTFCIPQLVVGREIHRAISTFKKKKPSISSHLNKNLVQYLIFSAVATDSKWKNVVLTPSISHFQSKNLSRWVQKKKSDHQGEREKERERERGRERGREKERELWQ